MATMFSKMYLVKALAIAAVAAIGAQATPAVASGELVCVQAKYFGRNRLTQPLSIKTVREASPAPVDAEDLVGKHNPMFFCVLN